MTYKEMYDYGRQKLESACVPEAALDARLLLEYICHTDRNALIVHGDSERSPLEEEFYRTVISRRSERIPLQYITGEQEFMGLSFRVNEHTLIPRQDTEILVEEAMRYLRDGMRILDMCTGSGCILLSLLKYSNECEGVGVDISDKALGVARENAKRLGIELGIEADFRQGDLFAAIEDGAKFDMLVSNPPYIESGEIVQLMPEVRDHEPVIALDGKEDGLYFYREIIERAPLYMSRGAMLLLEIGCNQAEAVCALMRERGFEKYEVIKDYAGLDRVICATYMV